MELSYDEHSERKLDEDSQSLTSAVSSIVWGRVFSVSSWIFEEAIYPWDVLFPNKARPFSPNRKFYERATIYKRHVVSSWSRAA